MNIKEQYSIYVEQRHPLSKKMVDFLHEQHKRHERIRINLELNRNLFEGTYEKETINPRTFPSSSLYPRQKYL